MVENKALKQALANCTKAIVAAKSFTHSTRFSDVDYWLTEALQDINTAYEYFQDAEKASA